MNYALITPARNEADLIEGTIRSVVAQTIRPVRWIIVSDGSTDGTDDIVRKYSADHPWIELLRLPERQDRQFAAKARAFNAGYAFLKQGPAPSTIRHPLSTIPNATLHRQPTAASENAGASPDDSALRAPHSAFDLIGNLDADITSESVALPSAPGPVPVRKDLRAPHSAFDLIGNLDADITFDPEYYSFLLARFSENSRLGVAGTPFVEDFSRPDSHSYNHANANFEHVSGAIQLFRRDCFEQVGGYVPVKGGAIDWIAVTTARMKGWETRTFTGKVCFHHRKLGTGTGANGALRMRFHYGRKAYYVGGHPLWELFRGIFAMRQKPFVLGGICFLLGYFWAAVCRVPRPVSGELTEFHRAEQMARFRKVFQRPANTRGSGHCHATS